MIYVEDIFEVYNSTPHDSFDKVKREERILKENMKISFRESERTIECDSSLIKLNTNIIGKILQEKFYNPSVQQVMRCYFKNLSKLSEAVRNSRIIDLIGHVKQIGAPSVQGYALKTKLNMPFLGKQTIGKINSLSNTSIVMKTPRREDSLLSEYLVGLLACNQIREIIPNVVYTYDIFTCESLDMDSDKTAEGTCISGGPEKEFLVIEDLGEVEGFGDYILKASVEEFINLFLQVLLTLKIMNDSVEFTHYDLHTDNVLVRKLPPDAKGKLIRYNLGYGECIDLPVDNIATLIDFGFSHAKINVGDTTRKVDVGIIGYGKYGVKWNDKFPLHDVYKLLLFSSEMVRGYNEEVYSVCEIIFKYFDDRRGALDYALDMGRSVTGVFMLTDVTTKDGRKISTVPLDHIIDHVLILGNYEKNNCTDDRGSYLNINLPELVIKDIDGRGYTCAELLEKIVINHEIDPSWPLDIDQIKNKLIENKRPSLSGRYEISYAILHSIVRFNEEIEKVETDIGLWKTIPWVSTEINNIKMNMGDKMNTLISSWNTARMYFILAYLTWWYFNSYRRRENLRLDYIELIFTRGDILYEIREKVQEYKNFYDRGVKELIRSVGKMNLDNKTSSNFSSIVSVSKWRLNE